MHMPGHKRILPPAPDLPYQWDVTEQEETDDLHHASGMLLAAMERAAGMYHAGASRFLVGGSTCGILAAIYSAVPHRGRVIAAANCHRSVFHAMELLQASPVLLGPGTVCGGAFAGSIDPEEVCRALERYPDSHAVIITGPTYEGVTSDIRQIAEAVHRAGRILIVDEAHGAHLGLYEPAYFGESAVTAGADIVIQSLHKTLPSLTQTAILHFDPERTEAARIDHALAVFETSSPSYPLMASIDGCIRLLTEEGPALFAAWKRRLDAFYERMRDLEVLAVFTGGGCFGKDPSKLVILTGGASMTGPEIAEQLRIRFGFAVEAADRDHIIAMTSPADTDEAIEGFADSLLRIDHELAMAGVLKEDAGSTGAAAAGEAAHPGDIRYTAGTGFMDKVFVTDIASALLDGEETGMAGNRTVTVSYEDCAGMVAGEYLYRYPPGIPVVIPGERISPATAAALAADPDGIRHSAGTDGSRIRCHTGGKSA